MLELLLGARETWDQGCRQPVRCAQAVKALPKRELVASNLSATFKGILEVGLQSVCVAEVPLPGAARRVGKACLRLPAPGAAVRIQT